MLHRPHRHHAPSFILVTDDPRGARRMSGVTAARRPAIDANELLAASAHCLELWRLRIDAADDERQIERA